jgi:hypothetical protein
MPPKLLVAFLAISSLGLAACMPADDAIDLSATTSAGTGRGGPGPSVPVGTGGSPAAVASGGTGTGGAPIPAPSGSGGASGSATPAAGGKGGSATGGNAGGAADAAASEASPPATTPPASSGGDPWASCGGSSFKPNVSPDDYCAKFMSACKFGGAGRFASMEDCKAKYSTLSDGPTGGKACVAWHLCVAADPPNAETFCPHGPEAAAMNGPCKPSYL